MDRESILSLLMGPAEKTLKELEPLLDRVGYPQTNGEVRLLGRIDISNYCAKKCLFCHQAANRWGVKRYRMEAPEIIACCIQAKALGCEGVILGSGMDPLLGAGLVTKIVRWMKSETGLPLTLSMGERSATELQAWRMAGADRYFLPIDSTDRILYRTLHPPDLKSLRGRIDLVKRARNMGYSIGGGIRVGLPGQTWRTLARDLETLRRLPVDYFEVGSFPYGPLAPGGVGKYSPLMASPDFQVPNDNLTTLKVWALVRLLRPKAMVLGPSMSSAPSEQRMTTQGIAFGINAEIMNLTPRRFWARFKKPIDGSHTSPLPASGDGVECHSVMGC
ncbi:radical SAM protein [Mesoterricola silvestris]|uniref:[FeFe] hydrogenase H-cluster radical SAM maturase HydE n=1 Tax=Mesoterricola silvestris TaxID=2927979 RepID=A0AA48GKR3_9BACT|nr:radical SAM protein [Mesoterricola silvestris]BDU73152.1 [FeFe] hydrogenase H-cluster radical SAM maturase HydE [Mesoterricola silvestris]